MLEEGNRKLRQLEVDLNLDKQMLDDVPRKSPNACSDSAQGRVPAGCLRRQRAPGLLGADSAPGQPPLLERGR